MPPRPPLAYRMLVGGVRFVLRVFFREIACEGREHIPTDRGGLLVAWHPNGLIDPALILAHFPGRLVFGARDGLLRWPVLGRLMRSLGTVPIYRAGENGAMGDEDRRRANQRSLDALAQELVSGSFAALFPEGRSHDQPYLSELKTGAARLYYRARERASDAGPTPVIIPVGLHYDRKDLFRSDVLVTFHEPMALPSDLLPPAGAHDADAALHARSRRLTDEIEQTLVHVVRATDDWQLHTLMHRARTLLRAEAAARSGTHPGKDSIVERSLGFAHIWHGYQVRRASHPQEIDALRRALTHYHRLLDTMRLEDHDLDQPLQRNAAGAFARLLARALAVYLILPPILLLGYLINGPVHLLIQGAARRYSGAAKDTATVKILVGFVLYPLAWALAGVLAALLQARPATAFPILPDAPVLVGLVVFALGFVSGVLVLSFTELERQTRRALRARLTRAHRKDTLATLRSTRARLHDQFVALAEGLDLPEDVTDHGRLPAR